MRESGIVVVRKRKTYMQFSFFQYEFLLLHPKSMYWGSRFMRKPCACFPKFSQPCSVRAHPSLFPSLADTPPPSIAPALWWDFSKSQHLKVTGFLGALKFVLCNFESKLFLPLIHSKDWVLPTFRRKGRPCADHRDRALAAPHLAPHLLWDLCFSSQARVLSHVCLCPGCCPPSLSLAPFSLGKAHC